MKLKPGEIRIGLVFSPTTGTFAAIMRERRKALRFALRFLRAMLTSGQSILDMFSQKADSNDLMQQAQIFIYANGNNQAPTAIDLDKSLLKDLLFNQSPAKDIALASVSMRPIPFSPVLEKLSEAVTGVHNHVHTD
ncbi:hypothetical protein LguiA_017305 [Lonicera macranthoides]